MSAPYAKTVMTANGKARPGTVPAAPGPAGRPVAGPARYARRGVHLRLRGADQAGRHRHRLGRVLPVPAGAAVAGRAGRAGAAQARAAAVRSRLWAMLAGVFLAIDLVLWNHAIADVGAGIATCSATCRWSSSRRGLAAVPGAPGARVLPRASGGAGRRGAGVRARRPRPRVRSLAGIEYGLGTSVAYAAFLLILRHSSAATPHVAARSPRRRWAPRPVRQRSAWCSAGGSSTSAGTRSAGCCCWP